MAMEQTLVPPRPCIELIGTISSFLALFHGEIGGRK
jgi:hypothetical protein